MNQYKIFAETYRQGVTKGHITREEADKKCKIFDFLGNCDQDDILNLYDSSAFNEVTRAYISLALNELISDGVISTDQGQSFFYCYNEIIDGISAREACALLRKES